MSDWRQIIDAHAERCRMLLDLAIADLEALRDEIREAQETQPFNSPAWRNLITSEVGADGAADAIRRFAIPVLIRARQALAAAMNEPEMESV